MSTKYHFTPEQAKEIANQLSIDFTKTGYDLELKDYYTRLAEMEEEGEEAKKT